MLIRSVTISVGSIATAILLFSGTVLYFDRKIDHVLGERGRPGNITRISDNTTVTSAAVVNQSLAIVAEKKLSFDDQIANSTLGFEKILGLSLPERTDRRDTLSLVAAYSDIKIEWMDAIKGENIDKKAWPRHWHRKANLSLGELGCWRSHLNAVKHVVEEGLSSALIIEDDADWDVNLKKQLQGFSKAIKALGNASQPPTQENSQTTNPYGDNWDLLWIGTCMTPQAPTEVQTFPGEGAEWPHQNHLVFRARGGLGCTWAYAINARSARSLYGWLLDVDEAIDFVISKWCGQHECITVWPQLIGSHEYPGPKGRDSDIFHSAEPVEEELARIEAGDEVREKGETWNILHSAILDTLSKVGRGDAENG